MFYPVFIELNGRRVLVVGGGPVAERKVDSLLEAGANVTVVSPEATDRLQKTNITWKAKPFEESDLDGMTLVVSATDDPEVQRTVAKGARARNLLVNTVDQPALCDFIVPAIVKRGDIIAAISTSGKSPALAAALRRKLEALLTDDVRRAADVLGSIRSEIHNRITDPDERKRAFEKIVESGIIEWIGECDDATALNRIRAMIDKS